MNYTTTIDHLDDLADREQWPDAESLARAALNRFGRYNRALRRRLAEVLLHVGGEEEAWLILNRHPDRDSEINVWRCWAAFRTLREKSGRRWLEKVLADTAGDETDLLLDLAQDLYRMQHYESSARLLDHLLAAAPEDAENLYAIHTGLALCARALCDDDVAQHAQAAYDLKPEDPFAQSLLGNAIFEAGDRRRGIHLLEKVGFDDLIDLRCEEGAKRLFRWHLEQETQPDEGLRRWALRLMACDEHHRWTSKQLRWVARCRDHIECSAFVVDDPQSGRLVGFAHDLSLSQRPLVNFSADGWRRWRALETCDYLGIPILVEPQVVDHWFDRVDHKVSVETSERFWEFVDAVSSARQRR